MNAHQRNFLIKKIEAQVESTINILRKSRPSAPSLHNYLLHAVMSGTFQIKTNEEIKALILKRAITSDQGRRNWMGTSHAFSSDDNLVFDPREIFIIPDEYQKLYDEYQKKDENIDRQIYELQIQSESLITRIQLASDKTLQKMIDEVDDMGNISLMETKLRLLN